MKIIAPQDTQQGWAHGRKTDIAVDQAGSIISIKVFLLAYVSKRLAFGEQRVQSADRFTVDFRCCGGLWACCDSPDLIRARI